MSYADRNRRPRPTLTTSELDRVLKVSGRDRDGFRDHVILSLAIGCGLRESEIVGLDVGDLLTDAGGVRQVIQLRVFKGSKRKGADARAQRVHVPPSTYYKLEKFARVEELGTFYRHAPVFWSRKGRRLSTRAVRALFARWQRLAGIDPPYNFHALRHTAVSLVRRRSKDIRIAQLFARHVSISTTTAYDHPDDDELVEAVRGQPG